jgi:hypothetical protein
VDGRTLLDDADLRVVALGDVRPRTVQTSWKVAMLGGWLAYLAPLALALGMGVRRRLRAPRNRLPTEVTGE